MEKYNYSKLIGKIKEFKYTQKQFAQKIGISECSLNLALNNKRNFRQDEITRAANELGLKSHEIEAYFFTHEV